jgi:SAM-dependent methyltransferase
VGTAAEHLHAATLSVESELGSELVRAAAQRDEWQIPAAEDREGYYGDNHANYWLSGLRDRQRALAWNSSAGNSMSRRVLEIGAASGRVIRHFAAQDPMCETWATDIDGQHVEWMAQHLGKQLIPVHTTVLPSLPLADDHLDLVLAYSVLTHIDVLETAWLAEIRRVLRPGGLAIVTVHTERSWELLEPGLGLHDSLLELAGSITEIDVSDAMLAGPMPAPRVAMSWPTVADVYNSVVFHSQEYIRDRWSRYFDVVDIIDEASEYQAVVVLRVPVSRS